METATKPQNAFAELGLSAPLLKALERMEIVTPSEIQQELIPPVLAGSDAVGQARTGTGKTLAFALPTLQKIEADGGVQAICVVPTRELALQVLEEVRAASRYSEVKVLAAYGGSRIQNQLRALERGVQFVIATPGRLLDLMSRGVLKTDEVRTVILDEVDRMLDIGFRDDIRKIFRHIKGKHQTIVVSATIDDSVEHLIRRLTTEPVWVNVSRDQISVSDIDEYYVTAEPMEKFDALKILLEEEQPDLAIIFTNTKMKARRLTQKLRDAGFVVGELHGDLRQNKREKVMSRFRKQNIHLLIATDIAARGLDVDDITHIINYDIPEDPEVHVHRVGRTGRMGRGGKAISLVTREEGKALTAIEMTANKLIPNRRLPGFESAPGTFRRR